MYLLTNGKFVISSKPYWFQRPPSKHTVDEQLVFLEAHPNYQLKLVLSLNGWHIALSAVVLHVGAVTRVWVRFLALVGCGYSHLGAATRTCKIFLIIMCCFTRRTLQYINLIAGKCMSLSTWATAQHWAVNATLSVANTAKNIFRWHFRSICVLPVSFAIAEYQCIWVNVATPMYSTRHSLCIKSPWTHVQFFMYVQ